MSYNATIEPGSKNSEPDILTHKQSIILDLWQAGEFKTQLTPTRLNKWLTWSRGSIEPIARAMLEVQGQPYPAMFVDDKLKRTFDSGLNQIASPLTPLAQSNTVSSSKVSQPAKVSLTQPTRMSKVQAQGFIRSHPDLSTRALAEATGIPHRTIARYASEVRPSK